jgi:hypothetical protein
MFKTKIAHTLQVTTEVASCMDVKSDFSDRKGLTVNVNISKVTGSNSGAFNYDYDYRRPLIETCVLMQVIKTALRARTATDVSSFYRI